MIYKYYTRHIYLPNYPNNRPDTEMITTINPAYLAVLTQAGSELRLSVAAFSSALNATKISLTSQFVNNTYLPQSAYTTILQELQVSPQVFVTAWLTGSQNTTLPGTNITNWTLGADLSSEISSTTAASLFNASIPYSLTNPTFFRLWQQALIDSSTALLLQQFWQLGQPQQITISLWAYKWATTIHPQLVLMANQASNITDLAYVQWAALNLTNGASVRTLNTSSTRFFPEFAAYARYVANVRATFTLQDARTIFDGNGISTGFRNATEWGMFLTLLNERNFTVIQARYSLNPLQCLLLYNYSNYIVSNTLGAALKSGGALFAAHTVRDFLFGYRDPLVSLLSPNSGNVSVIRNFTSLEDTQANQLEEERDTGQRDVGSIENYIRYSNVTALPYWATPEYFRGTDGLTRAPRFGIQESYYVFSDTLQRNVALGYNRTVKVKKITLKEFVLPSSELDSYHKNPANARYFTEYDGFHNFTTVPISGVVGVPIFLSKPHMLQADPQWSSKVLLELENGTVINGMQPDIGQHDTYVRVEQQSGVTMDARKRIQVNAFLQPELFGLFNNVNQTMFVPIYWGDEGSTITDKQAHDFRSSVYGADTASRIVLGICVGLGGLLFITGTILGLLGVVLKPRPVTV